MRHLRTSPPNLQTLPDYLGAGLRLISIGLNPSLPSVRAGFYFANPRNRFWKALHGSRLLSANYVPASGVEHELVAHEGIGFTDVVKRATRGGHELCAADYRTWAPVLEEKLRLHAPRCAWFHGKLAYRNFLRHSSLTSVPVVWGAQPVRIGTSIIFVTPNPSPANAAYSLDDLIAWYDRLAACVAAD
ncbi:MAG: mismatch-specific DNA-glycosylase [Gammaproteobacteria bacterium]|nr:mismatch-specific DNA-glycosylase [Gammaproteobacteria bacterium]